MPYSFHPTDTIYHLIDIIGSMVAKQIAVFVIDSDDFLLKIFTGSKIHLDIALVVVLDTKKFKFKFTVSFEKLQLVWIVNNVLTILLCFCFRCHSHTVGKKLEHKISNQGYIYNIIVIVLSSL